VSDFGDSEPEDAWDAGDTVPEQVRNLIRRVELLVRYPVRVGGDARETLAALRRLVRRARRRRLYGRELLRADQIDEDIEFVESRL